MSRSRSLSAWCVDHPIATILLTFALVLLGLIAFPRLPIAPLPEAEFPTIQVSAQLPGASPDTILAAVAVLNMDDAGNVGGAAAMSTLILFTSAGVSLLLAWASRGVLRRSQAWRQGAPAQ